VGFFFAAGFFATGGFSWAGFARQITSTLPISCTGWASSREQSSAIHWVRALRSSLAALTLMSSWAFSARSTSAMTASVRPLSPMMTTGLSGWASARSSLRRAGDRGVGMAQTIA
jgi:hypothetical protein